MARRSKFTTPDAAANWAAFKGAPIRGSLTPITSKTRGLVRFWLTAAGVPSERAVTLSLAELGAAWHDTTGAALARLITARDATPAEIIQPETPTAPQETETMPMQHPFVLTPPPADQRRTSTADREARLRALADLIDQPAALDENAVVEIVSRRLGETVSNAIGSAVDTARADLAQVLEEARAIVNGAPRVLKIEIAGRVRELPAAVRHPLFDTLLTLAVCSKQPRAKFPMLVGPAGGGKTTAAEQVAQALGLPFYSNGALTGAHELTGYKDAAGQYHGTPFRQAFEHGGVYLADEMDRSDPAAVLALNSALANGFMGFPDQAEPIRAHSQFYIIAACNTYGRGADRIYIGANQLDGATLDRFGPLTWDYDEQLERSLAGDDAWTSYVQEARDAASTLKIRHVISPRASYYGATLRAAGLPFDMVAEIAIWKGLDADQRGRITAAIPENVARRAQAAVIRAMAAE
jgi:MoxR-like ATPase